MQWIVILALFAQESPEVFKAVKPKGPTAEQVQIKLLQDQLQAANSEVTQLHKQINALESEKRDVILKADREAATKPFDIDITGLGNTGPIRRVQWILTTSPSCGPCHTFVDGLTVALGKRYKVGATDECDFKIVSLTLEEWTKSGFTLPRMDLMIDGVSTFNTTGGKITFAQIEERYVAELAKQQGPTFGLRAGTLPIKPQVTQFLKSLQLFLDGGTLTIEYKPKPGVVKEYLTIQQGQVAIRIPAKTSLSLGFDNEQALIKFNQPTIQVRLPIRGNTDIKSMTLTPSEFAIQLSYMLDPTWLITDPPVKASGGKFAEDLNPFNRYLDSKKPIFAKWK